MKLPAFQFYPADWRKDPGVQALSYHDRGVWFEILCLMHESEQRGKLLLNGKAMPEDALARLLGLDKQNLSRTLTTLLDYGVMSRDEETGALISRRMVRDESIRKMRQEVGKLGGNPNLVNQKSNQKSERQDNQIPTPSSSSSPSTTNQKSSRRDAGAPRKPNVIWDLGVTMLVNAGWTEANARSFIGKQAKEYGQQQLAQAISATSSANPANPHEYLVKTLKEQQTNGNGKHRANGRPTYNDRANAALAEIYELDERRA